MKKTYYIEDNNGNILGYYSQLCEAKKHYMSKKDEHPDSTLKIVAMRGAQFGEGFHIYKLELINGKFKKEKA